MRRLFLSLLVISIFGSSPMQAQTVLGKSPVDRVLLQSFDPAFNASGVTNINAIIRALILYGTIPLPDNGVGITNIVATNGPGITVSGRTIFVSTNYVLINDARSLSLPLANVGVATNWVGGKVTNKFTAGILFTNPASATYVNLETNGTIDLGKNDLTRINSFESDDGEIFSEGDGQLNVAIMHVNGSFDADEGNIQTDGNGGLDVSGNISAGSMESASSIEAQSHLYASWDTDAGDFDFKIEQGGSVTAQDVSANAIHGGAFNTIDNLFSVAGGSVTGGSFSGDGSPLTGVKAVTAVTATNDDLGNKISKTYMPLSNSVSNPSLQIGKLEYDARGFHYMSPIGYDPHFYTGGNWNETNIWNLIDGIKACGIASATHGQYSVDVTHWQGPPAQMTNVPNQWMLLPDTNKFIHGFQWTLNYAHSNGCILKLYFDSVVPFGNDTWTTNSAGQNIGGWTNVLPNLTNLAGLYPTLDGIHYDANAGEDGPTAYYRAFTVDNVWRSLITNRPTFFEHDTMPGSYMFNHRLLSSFPDGTLFGLLADPTGVALTNGFFNYLMQAVDEQTNLGLMFPTSGKFIHPQQVPIEGANQGYAWSAYINMSAAFGWGMIVSAANGGAANYTTSTGPPLVSADYVSGLWATNQDFIYCKEDAYSSAFIARQDLVNKWQVWSRELTDGSYVVLLYNRNLTVTNNVSFTFNQIGGLGQYYIPPAAVVVRDILYGTNLYCTGLDGFTNAVMPNEFGEAAKAFRVYFLNDKPYDQAQGYGNVAPLGDAKASTVTITNNTANGANTSGDFFIYKPLGTVPQIHWQKTNVYWNWEMDNHVGDYAITFYSFPDFNTPKFDFRTNGDLLVSGDLIIGQHTGTPHFTLSGYGDFMRVNGNGGLVISAAKNLSTEFLQLGLDNNTAGEQFYAKGTLIGKIQTNGMFISVGAVFTNNLDVLGVISGNGGGLTNIQVVASNYFGCTIATNTLVYTVPSGVTNNYEIGGWINVTAVTLDVVRPQVSYTDRYGTIQTFYLASGISVTGANPIAAQQIEAKGGTAITLSAQLTTGTGSITYDSRYNIKLAQ